MSRPHVHCVWILVAVAVALGPAACFVTLDSPTDAQISCAVNTDCPEGYRCTAGRCVSLSANRPPRVVVGAPERSLDTVAIPIVVSDDEGDTVSFTATYDDGGSEAPATLAPLEVVGSAQGVSAALIWDAATDLGSAAYVADLIVRVTPTGGSPADSLPFAFGNDPPELSAMPVTGQKSGDVGVAFTLTDGAADLAAVRIEFSDAAGGPWSTAAISLGATTFLSTSEAGIEHAVIWNSRAAVNGDTNEPQGIGAGPTALRNTVFLRLTGSDTVLGQTATSAPVLVGPFAVDNTSNAAPGVVVQTPEILSGDTFLISYQLFDAESDPCELVVEMDDGTGFVPATDGLGGDGKVGLTSSDVGTTHTYAWDSFAAGVGLSGVNSQVRLRLAARGPAQGVFSTTAYFAVDNQTHNQTPTLVPIVPSLSVVSGGDAVSLPFLLQDAEADDVDLQIQFQDEQGSWFDASIDATSPLVGLSTSPSGDLSTAVWHSLSQGVAPTRTTVHLQARVVQSTPSRTGAWTSFDLTVDNGATLNTPPTVRFIDAGPTVVRAEDYPLYVRVQDAESDDVRLDDFAFTLDGTAWIPAAVDFAPGTNFASSPEGIVYRIVWDGAHDVGAAKALLGSTPIPLLALRIGPEDDYNQGAYVVDAHDLGSLETVELASPPLDDIDSSAAAVRIDGLTLRGAGEVHVFWHTPFPTGPWVIRHAASLDGGSTFAASTAVTSTSVPDVTDGTPTAAQAGSTLLVAYTVTTSTTKQLRVRTSGNGGATWSAAINITTTNTEAAQAQFFVETSSIINLVWRDWASPNSRVYFSRSTNSGASWSAAVAVSNLEAQQNVYPAIVKTGATLLAMWQGGGNNLMYTTSANNGASFATPAVITTTPGGVISMIADPSGDVHATFRGTAVSYIKRTGTSWGSLQTLQGDGETNPKIAYVAPTDSIRVYQARNNVPSTTFFVESFDRGATFSAPRELLDGAWSVAVDSSTGLGVAGIVLNLTGTNGPYVVPFPRHSLPRTIANAFGSALGIGGDRTSIRTIWTDGGLVLGQPGAPWLTTEVATPGAAGFARLAISGNGGAHFALASINTSMCCPSYTVHLTGSNDDGQSWAGPVSTSSADGDLAVAPSGVGYFVGVGAAPGTLSLLTSSNAGQNWSGPTALSSLGSANQTPRLLWLNGRLHMTYLDTTPTFDVIRYANSADGVAWSSPINVSQNASRSAVEPRLDGNAAGRVVVGWNENLGGTYQPRTSVSVNNGGTFATPRDAGIETIVAGLQDKIDVALDPGGELYFSWLAIGAVASLVSSVDNGVSWIGARRLGAANSLVLQSDVRATYVVSVDSLSVVRLQALRDAHIIAAALPSPVPIPDATGAPLLSILTLPVGETIHDIGVWVDLAHDNAAQLTVTLLAPDATPYVLSQGGGARVWDGPILFTDAGIAADDSLSSLNGAPVGGVWTLEISDGTAGIAGTLHDWGLQF